MTYLFAANASNPLIGVIAPPLPPATKSTSWMTHGILPSWLTGPLEKSASRALNDVALGLGAAAYGAVIAPTEFLTQGGRITPFDPTAALKGGRLGLTVGAAVALPEILPGLIPGVTASSVVLSGAALAGIGDAITALEGKAVTPRGTIENFVEGEALAGLFGAAGAVGKVLGLGSRGSWLASLGLAGAIGGGSSAYQGGSPLQIAESATIAAATVGLFAGGAAALRAAPGLFENFPMSESWEPLTAKPTTESPITPGTLGPRGASVSAAASGGPTTAPFGGEDIFAAAGKVRGTAFTPEEAGSLLPSTRGFQIDADRIAFTVPKEILKEVSTFPTVGPREMGISTEIPIEGIEGYVAPEEAQGGSPMVNPKTGVLRIETNFDLLDLEAARAAWVSDLPASEVAGFPEPTPTSAPKAGRPLFTGAFALGEGTEPVPPAIGSAEKGPVLSVPRGSVPGLPSTILCSDDFKFTLPGRGSPGLINGLYSTQIGAYLGQAVANSLAKKRKALGGGASSAVVYEEGPYSANVYPPGVTAPIMNSGVTKDPYLAEAVGPVSEAINSPPKVSAFPTSLLVQGLKERQSSAAAIRAALTFGSASRLGLSTPTTSVLGLGSMSVQSLRTPQTSVTAQGLQLYQLTPGQLDPSLLVPTALQTEQVQIGLGISIPETIVPEPTRTPPVGGLPTLPGFGGSAYRRSKRRKDEWGARELIHPVANSLVTSSLYKSSKERESFKLRLSGGVRLPKIRVDVPKVGGAPRKHGRKKGKGRRARANRAPWEW